MPAQSWRSRDRFPRLNTVRPKTSLWEGIPQLARRLTCVGLGRSARGAAGGAAADRGAAVQADAQAPPRRRAPRYRRLLARNDAFFDVRFVVGLSRSAWRRIRTRRRCAMPPTTPPRSLCSCSAWRRAVNCPRPSAQAAAQASQLPNFPVTVLWPGEVMGNIGGRDLFLTEPKL